MKRLFTLLMLVLAIAAGASAQQSKIYEKCRNEKNVTVVSISKTMLQMAGNLGSMGDNNLALIKDKLDNVLIVTSDNSKGRNFISKFRDEFTEKKGFESLMTVNNDGDNVMIFSKKLSEGKNEFVLSILESDGATMIVLDGSLTIDDIAKMTGQNVK